MGSLGSAEFIIISIFLTVMFLGVYIVAKLVSRNKD
jgi:heme/copper-type cytochrome/quinol oxidase subunit 2